MRRKYIFVIWSCNRLKGKILRFSASKTSLSRHPHGPTVVFRSKGVPLLQFILCACVGSFICGVCFVVISSSLLTSPFGASGRLGFMIVAFPGYLNL